MARDAGRIRVRRAVALVVALIGTAGGIAPANASEPDPVISVGGAAPAAAASGGQAPQGDAPVQIVVNGVAHDVVIARFLEGDVWVPLATLRAAGLERLRGEQKEIAGEPWVSLRSLAPGLTYALDERTLELRLEARAELLGRIALDARGAGRPEGLLTGGHPSAFANYSVLANDQQQISAFGELGVGAGSWLATSGISRSSLGDVVRGLSAVTREEPERLRRWTAGDGVATAGPLGGTLVLGGLSLETDFTLDPWFVRQPLPRASAVTLTPSTLEVYVNGRLVRRDTVAPGTIDLSNVPVEAGAGSVRTVLRDAFGRTQEVSSSYYFSGGLLTPGVNDYGAYAGFRRSGLGAQSFEYASPVGIGRWRRGITDGFTGGGRLEVGQGLVSGGPVLDALVPFGEIEAAVAGSAGAGSSGLAGSLAWTRTSRKTMLGLRAISMSPAYSHASLTASQDRAALQTSGFATFAVAERATLGIEATAARMRSGDESGSVNLRATLGFGRGASLMASMGWARETTGAAGPVATLLFTHVLGSPGVANATTDRSASGQTLSSVGLERPLPAGSGIGYRFNTSAGDGAMSSALVQAQGEHGRLEAAYDRVAGRGTGYATASGAVVWMDREVSFTRALQEGYALVQVPGVEGVRVDLNGSEVGRTNARGNLLVPGLLPYNANRVAIHPADVPIDYALESVEQLVAPGRRIGAAVRFDVKKIQTLTGVVLVAEAGRDVAPAYGEMRVSGAREPCPLGKDGRFYVETLAAGRHEAEVEYAGGRCSLVLVVPESADALTDVGSLRCTAAPLAALAPTAN